MNLCFVCTTPNHFYCQVTATLWASSVSLLWKREWEYLCKHLECNIFQIDITFEIDVTSYDLSVCCVCVNDLVFVSLFFLGYIFNHVYIWIRSWTNLPHRCFTHLHHEAHRWGAHGIFSSFDEKKPFHKMHVTIKVCPFIGHCKHRQIHAHSILLLVESKGFCHVIYIY